MKQQPVVGVTRSSKHGKIFYYATKFILWIYGTKTVLLTPASPHYGEHLDGLILGGGMDVHPQRYGQKPKVNYSYEEDRDELETRWLGIAQQKNLPVLGICRGAQLINIVRNGTLHIDVQKAYEKAKYPTSLLARIFYRKRMYIKEKTLLFQILERKTLRVNSIHTQSIDQLGVDLIISAEEANHVVQAIEDPNRAFFLGLQYHPELLIYSKYYRKIFAAFVQEAKNISQARINKQASI